MHQPGSPPLKGAITHIWSQAASCDHCAMDGAARQASVTEASHSAPVCALALEFLQEEEPA